MFNGMSRDRSSLEDKQRDVEQSLLKANRDNELERKRLQEEEEKIEKEVRINTELGNSDICRILAKQLVDIRRQKARAFAANSKINARIHQHRANSAHRRTINAMLAMGPNHFADAQAAALHTANVANLSANAYQRLNRLRNALKDINIETDDEDDYTSEDHPSTSSKRNSGVTHSATSDANTNSDKEANTTNALDAPNSSNAMQTPKSTTKTVHITDTTNKTNGLRTTGNTTMKSKSSAGTAASNPPANRQFSNRADTRRFHLNDKTKSS